MSYVSDEDALREISTRLREHLSPGTWTESPAPVGLCEFVRLAYEDITGRSCYVQDEQGEHPLDRRITIRQLSSEPISFKLDVVPVSRD